MKTKTSIMLVAFTAISFNLEASEPPPAAPLPEFMSREQLAKWTTKEEFSGNNASAVASESQFFTRKPYVENVGGFVYEYRTYNPEMNRWTTTDPSGFPDGANNNLYVNNPAAQFDPQGLAKMSSLTGALHWYDGNPRPETFTGQFSDYYADVNYKPLDFDGFSSQYSAANNGTSIDIVRNYNWGDSYAIGRGNLEMKGTVTVDPVTNAKSFVGNITI